MRTELVITTYNAPQALHLVLLALKSQSQLPDVISIADDGSGPSTTQVIDHHSNNLPLRHVWHADTGFNKNVILNQAIRSSDAEYMIFIDGDCLASPSFIARHMARARKNTFVSGSVVRLSSQTTAAIDDSLVAAGTVFQSAWLKAQGELSSLSRQAKAGNLPPLLAKLADTLSPVRITWSGGNASAHRDTLLAVNGFDETMKYGGEDKELGARLLNAGVKGRLLRYTAPLLHMHHSRGYVDAEIVAQNRSHILETRKTKRVWAEAGIIAHTSALHD